MRKRWIASAIIMGVAATLSSVRARAARADDCLRKYEAKISQLQSELKQERSYEPKLEKRYSVYGKLLNSDDLRALLTAGLINVVASHWDRLSGQHRLEQWNDHDRDVRTESDATSARADSIESELQGTQSAYYMLREASTYQAPGQVIRSVFNGTNRDLYFSAVFPFEAAQFGLDQARFTRILAQANTSDLFCDSKGNVDDISNVTQKVIDIVEDEQAARSNPSVVNRAITSVKSSDDEGAVTGTIELYVPKSTASGAN